MISLSKVGMGQSISVTPSKSVVCDGEQFNLTITSSQKIWFYVQVSTNSGTTWNTVSFNLSTTGSGSSWSYLYPGITISANSRIRLQYSIISNNDLINNPLTSDNGLVVNWNPIPDAIVATPSTICNGTSVNIGSSPVIGNTYSWSSSLGSFSSTNSNPSVTPTLSQTYTLTETITATGCFHSNQVSITVNNVSSGTISGSQAICVGGNPSAFSSIDGTGDGTIGYKWEFKPNGQNVWNVDPSLLINIYDPPTGLTITTDYRRYTTSILNSVSCTSTPTNEVKVTVNPTPTVDAVTNQIKCNGINSDAINFTSSVTGATFTWTNSLSSIGIAPSGSGNISSTLLSNSTNTASLATFNVSPSANS